MDDCFEFIEKNIYIYPIRKMLWKSLTQALHFFRQFYRILLQDGTEGKIEPWKPWQEAAVFKSKK